MTAEEFASIRKRLALTQEELGPLIGVATKHHVSRMENGRRPVSDQVALLLRAYESGYRPKDWPA